MTSHTNNKAPQKSPMKNWEKKATVRNSPNRYSLSEDIEIELQSKSWFLESALPWLSHPAIRAGGKELTHNILARYLIFFLEYTTTLEHKIVNPAVEVIAHDELALAVPPTLSKAAFQLYVDEGYHALVAASLADEVSSYYGFRRNQLLIQRIERLQNQISLNVERSKLASFIAGFVSETSITKELLNFTSRQLVTPSYHMLHDHLIDELQHSIYFSSAFHFAWNRFDESAKTFVSDLLLNLISEFFRLDDVWLIQTLVDVGISTQVAVGIQAELQTKDACIARLRSGASGTVDALMKTDFFDYKNNSSFFRKAGIING